MTFEVITSLIDLMGNGEFKKLKTQMKQSTILQSLTSLTSVAVLSIGILSCSQGKKSDQASADSIQAKITADSVSLQQNMSDSLKKTSYIAGVGKSNPSKIHGKGLVILQPNTSIDEQYNAMTIEMDKQGIYNKTEIRPSYPGGQKALAKFVQDNIVYPEDALGNGVEAEVQVIFAVDEAGKVYTPTIKGAKTGYGLDEAATNVVNKMPKWNPGKIKGVNVKSYYTLPITFKIE